VRCVSNVLLLGDVITGLMLIGPLDPLDSEFTHVMDSLSDTMARAGAQLERVRLMTITDGGAPTVRQRARISQWLGGRQMKVSIVSRDYDNPIKRGITTAVQWINPALGFFRPTEIRRAIAHVDLTSEVPRIWKEYEALEARLGPLQVMAAVRASLAV
jgi:hypothetical protein